jgi:hypothetical protein
MKRIVTVALMFCAVSAVPVLGDWDYDGTYTDVSDPESWVAEDGTCGYEWNGSGCSVSGSEHELTVSGSTWGNAWVGLTPDLGLSRSVWAASHVYGKSSYSWAGGSHYVSGNLSASLSGSLTFSGNALDRTATCDASCSSSCASGGSAHSPFRASSAGGGCYGWASSTSGTYAFTNPFNVTPTTNYANYNQGFLSGWYNGALSFSGSLSASFSGDVASDGFDISAEVYGSGSAGGELVINDPNDYWGGVDASGNYSSSGTSYVYVTW